MFAQTYKTAANDSETCVHAGAHDSTASRGHSDMCAGASTVLDKAPMAPDNWYPQNTFEMYSAVPSPSASHQLNNAASQTSLCSNTSSSLSRTTPLSDAQVVAEIREFVKRSREGASSTKIKEAVSDILLQKVSEHCTRFSEHICATSCQALKCAFRKICQMYEMYFVS
jgi:hypothetical protein